MPTIARVGGSLEYSGYSSEDTDQVSTYTSREKIGNTAKKQPLE